MDDRMKLKIAYLAIAGIGLALLTVMSSCSKQNIVSDKKITCTPDSFMLLPDSSNQAALNLQVHIPKHYFSKRSRLFVIPVLTDSDSIVAKYKPIVLDAPIYRRKMERKWILDSIADPYDSIAQRVTNTKVDLSVLYNDTITLPANFHKGSLVAVASADGCGECRAISHTKIADVFRPEIKKQLHLNWMMHTFEIKPKIREGKGVARLEFVINKYDINLKMSNNQAELDHMLSDIAPVLSDSLATLTSLGIYGLASADGPLKFNTPLSRNRANSALKWLLAHIENGDKVKKIARIGSRPEGWQPVLDAMVAAGDADSTMVKNILTRYANFNDDVQERYIRRLPIWNSIKKKYLQKSRSVEYTYTYIIKNFTTDEEMLQMYELRPDAFSEDEFLHVAQIAESAEKQKLVYETTLKYYPMSKIAANNLAILLENEGKVDEAEEILNRQKAEETKNSPKALSE